MKLVKLSEIFDINHGNSLELNALYQIDNGVNFIGRSEKNNGVTAKVKTIDNIEPFQSGLITVALSGSVLSTFLQNKPFYTGYHVAVLTAKITMDENHKLFFCHCIKENKFRYSYGRQANRTLKDLLIPSIQEVPKWALLTKQNFENKIKNTL